MLNGIHLNFGPGHGYYVNEWNVLCERCPLPDCVRKEGDMQGVNGQPDIDYAGCPIYIAHNKNGWTVDQALANGDRLNLLKEEYNGQQDVLYGEYPGRLDGDGITPGAANNDNGFGRCRFDVTGSREVDD